MLLSNVKVQIRNSKQLCGWLFILQLPNVYFCFVSHIRAVHTMKIMRIKFESIRIGSIHNEAALTAMRIQFTFSQSTSIGGLKLVCNHNPLIT